jgi:hypothetical protein
VAASTDTNNTARSLQILEALNGSDWFNLHHKETSQVQLYHVNSEGRRVPTQRISVEDFLMAVDYYQEHRDLEVMVALAMRSPEGVVRVYEKKDGGNVLALNLINYKVVEILEFGYMLLRKGSK